MSTWAQPTPGRIRTIQTRMVMAHAMVSKSAEERTLLTQGRGRDLRCLILTVMVSPTPTPISRPRERGPTLLRQGDLPIGRDIIFDEREHFNRGGIARTRCAGGCIEQFPGRLMVDGLGGKGARHLARLQRSEDVHPPMRTWRVPLTLPNRSRSARLRYLHRCRRRGLADHRKYRQAPSSRNQTRREDRPCPLR